MRQGTGGATALISQKSNRQRRPTSRDKYQEYTHRNIPQRKVPEALPTEQYKENALTKIRDKAFKIVRTVGLFLKDISNRVKMPNRPP